MARIKSKKIYSRNVLHAVRYFGIITLLLLILSVALSLSNFIREDWYSSYGLSTQIETILTIFINILVIIFAIILIVHPQRFFLIGVGGLLYSVLISYYVPLSAMGVLMLGVSISTFLIRYGHNRNLKLPAILFFILYILEMLLPLIHGVDDYLEIVIFRFGITFTFSIILYFFKEYIKQQEYNEISNEKKLNLALYPGLERSDLSLLQEVLNNVKYKEIARKLHGSEGALRNKLSRLYKILEVGDRTGFITLYSGYELVYEPISEPVLEKN